jgi:hypothetical protein
LIFFSQTPLIHENTELDFRKLKVCGFERKKNEEIKITAIRRERSGNTDKNSTAVVQNMKIGV